MKGTKVTIKEDLAIALYTIGKKEDKPISVLVDQMIREGLRRRRLADEVCPF